MAGYATTLFDLDGTLIDSVELILESYRHTFVAHGLPTPPDPAFVALMGLPLYEALLGFARDADQAEAMVATYREYNLLHHDKLVTPYYGVHDTLAELKRRGSRLGVVTSKRHEDAVRGLRVTGLASFFEVVVGCDDVKHKKPHPEPVHAGMHALGAVAASTLFVGDSPHDLQAGRAAGVATAAALFGPFEAAVLQACLPDHLLVSMPELLTLKSRPDGAETVGEGALTA